MCAGQKSTDVDGLFSHWRPYSHGKRSAYESTCFCDKVYSLLYLSCKVRKHTFGQFAPSKD